MRIFQLITRSGQGGAQLNALSLTRAAIRAGHEVTVGVGDEGWLTERAAAEGAEIALVRSLKRSWNPASVPLLLSGLRSELVRRRPDILHMHSSNALFGVLAAASLGPRAPGTVATVHGLSVLHPGWEGSAAKRLAYGQAVKRLWSGCGRVVFVCRSDMEFAIARGLVPAERSVVIRNGLDAPADFLGPREARFRLGVPTCKSGMPVVGTVARLSAEKDLDLFIDAARLMSGDRCVFRIVGRGPEEFRLARKIRDRGLDGRIAVLRGGGDERRVMRGFDVFLMTSRYEGLPYTLLEAAHAGVPVVSVATGGVPEVIADGETGLLVSGRDPAALAGSVRRLLDAPELAARISAAARERVRSSFTEDGMARAALTTYQALLQHEIA